jgi:hypothetical protein
LTVELSSEFNTKSFGAWVKKTVFGFCEAMDSSIGSKTNALFVRCANRNLKKIQKADIFILYSYLSKQLNKISKLPYQLGQYRLYVESIFSHHLAESSIFSTLVVINLYALLYFTFNRLLGSKAWVLKLV